MKKKEILYPVFLSVSHLSADVFWKYLYEDLAYGICPFGTFMNNDSVFCRFKGKQFNYQFSSKEPEEIETQLTYIFKTQLNIQSKMDYLSSRADFSKILDTSHNKEWKDIKKKNIKDILLDNFIIKMKNKYNFNASQTHKLMCFIITGFQFKIITNLDIEYDSVTCSITNIKGIDVKSLITEKKFSITIDPKIIESPPAEKLLMSDLWLKNMY
jgi:hypothetical protein